jgi:putative ABC transport system ATP-binding protein
MLQKRLELVLKYPKLALLPTQAFNILKNILVLLGGLLVAIITASAGSDAISALIMFVVGAYVSNKVLYYVLNYRQGLASELNTFVVTYKEVEKENFKDDTNKAEFEELLRKEHRKYKRSLLKSIQNSVKSDTELKTSVKLLKSLAEDVNTKLEDQTSIDLEHWAYQTLDRIHKGTRLNYWHNINGYDQVVLINDKNEKERIKLKKNADQILDELNLLVFAHRYSTTIAPILEEVLQYTQQFDEFFSNFVDTFKGNNGSDEYFAEAYTVLLSKSLGMQEVLKSTTRQFDRMGQIKEELISEAHDIGIIEIQDLMKGFLSNDLNVVILKNIDQLKKSLSHVAKNLRKINLSKVPKGSKSDVEFIAKFYIALEKLRFTTSWFDDIASYTAVAGGLSSEIAGVTVDKINVAKDVVLKVDDLYKNYITGGGIVYALRGTSLEIRKGEFVGVTGTSGSGKTTLLNIMAGLDNPDRGSVYIEGTNIHSLSGNKLKKLRRDKMGFIFQFYNLLPLLKNKENVAYPAEIAGKTKKLSQRVANNLLTVQLQEFSEQYPNKLSGGQMQRVTIARSTINTPKILFADEPTGDLDSVTGEEVMNVLKDLNEKGATIVFVTHDPSMLKYCTRVITMKDGKVEN